jgi:hypothetical protein
MDETTKDELIKLILSGAASGALLGGGGRLLSGARSLGQIAKGAGVGAAASGGLTGLSGAIGLGVGGSPSEEEGSGYSKRLGVGGAIAGGLAGAGLGALMGSKGGRGMALKALQKLGQGDVARDIKRGTTVLGRGIGTLQKPAYAAAGLGAGGAAVGAFQGADEGMQLDFLHNLSREQKERMLRQKMMEEV